MEVLRKNIDILNKVRNTGILRFLSDDEFSEISKFINILSFDEGEVIVKEGERPGGIFVILSGKVKVVKDKVELATLTKEEFFGEGEILMSSPASASVISASSPTEVIYIIKGAFDTLEKQNPRFALIFYKILAKTIFLRLIVVDREFVKATSEIQNNELREKLRRIREKIFRSKEET